MSFDPDGESATIIVTASHDTPPRCRLLELPAELREQIWNLAVSDWIPIKPGDDEEEEEGEDEEDESNNYPSEEQEGTHQDLPATSSESVLTLLRRAPIRIDRFNHIPPAAITRTCSQIRFETLQRYYNLNRFECWRPRFRRKGWIYSSSLIGWLQLLGPEQRGWLRSVTLLHKPNDDLSHDPEQILVDEGLPLPPGVLRQRLLLSEYEQCFEQLGLPRHFGKKRPKR
ncbi:uncharacterized protein K489DRAFT_36967 [Dissoconium aciculare CBS 342.82]|uniref:2EXR domain-containing protein n=1 Tax=Dissoconium aciculare CBS 342.82 TaxID=1314786 RepID=A0A6J3LY58_9PEZI|nr:uncharacterized protein K489DRAFT_36967 [Dissoconium aciculare CBS 342.82]KAF1820588.1 hypothetical protein K489DRAFT_36967 [Dissoconium aciculare CBS 342.82]